MFTTRLLACSLLTLCFTTQAHQFRRTSGDINDLDKAVHAEIFGIAEKSGIAFYDDQGESICSLCPFNNPKALNSDWFQEWLEEHGVELNQLKSIRAPHYSLSRLVVSAITKINTTTTHYYDVTKRGNKFVLKKIGRVRRFIRTFKKKIGK